MSTAPLVAPASGKNFEPASEGVCQGVIAEVRDMGLQDQTFNGITKKVHKVLFRWQLAELDEEKQPKRIYEKFTFSTHEKSKGWKRICGIFGKTPPLDFNWRKMEGVNSNLMIVRNTNEKDGKVYANIVGTTKLRPDQKKLEIVPIPKKDEVKAEVNAALKQSVARPVTAADPIDDSEIPF